MKEVDYSKFVFYALCVSSALGLTFFIGLHAGANHTFLYRVVNRVKTTLATAVSSTAQEATTITKIHPTHFLQPSRYHGSGVTLNKVHDQGELILLSGFFRDTNELQLIRRDGTVVNRWPVQFSKLFPDPKYLANPPQTDWNVGIHGALVLPDGSTVFNFDDAGLAKLDRCGEVQWTLRHATHHSIERAEGGGFWVPGRRMVEKGQKSSFPPFEPPYLENTIMHVSEDGKVTSETSFLGLLYENDFGPLFTSVGAHLGVRWWVPEGREIEHLNKIGELTSDIAGDFPMFESGDLIVSTNKHNLVVVFDPRTNKVKWWRIGPWMRQHDPEFRAGGVIGVFNNNMMSAVDGPFDFEKRKTAALVSNIVEVDPATGASKVIYGTRPGQEFLSIARGKFEYVPSGGLLVTEAENGRVFQTDPDGNLVWEYINRYDDDEVAELTESRIYPKDYFDVASWSCP